MRALKRLWSHKNRLLFMLFGVLFIVSVFGAIILDNKFKAEGEIYYTYYIRVDGGTDTQCNGLIDAAYPGTGINQNCAWKHPFYALPPTGAAGANGIYSVKIHGGDTLIIGPGEYRMGYNPLEEDLSDGRLTSEFIANLNYGPCYSGEGNYTCTMPAIPSGPDTSHPTRIIGAGWETKTGAKPQLWATEKASQVINLTSSSNIDIQWLDITDHSACVGSGSVEGEVCNGSSFPHGDWGSNGITGRDSQNVLISNTDIHGFAGSGIWAGRLANWSLDSVRISANGSAGWNTDLGDDYRNGNFISNNTGDFSLKHVTVEWSGCAETYPELQPTHCKGQAAGGYGDGIGLAKTGGNWLIEDSNVSHNAQDGLDLLYHVGGGSITLNRVWSEGNMGNAVKIAGNSTVTNSVIIGNCGFFADHPEYMDGPADFCRAGGTPLVTVYVGGETSRIINSTIYSQGDVIIGAGPRVNCAQVDQDLALPGNENNQGLLSDKAEYCTIGGTYYTASTYSSCNGNEQLIGRNNILYGDWDLTGGRSDKSAYFYFEHCGNLVFDSDYSVYDNGKISMYLAGSHDINANPLLTIDPILNPTVSFLKEAGAFKLSEGSPAIGTGTPVGAPVVDYALASRDAPPDIGAYEYVATNEGSINIDMPTSSSSDGRFHTYVNKSLTLEPTVSNATTYQWTSSGPGSVTLGSATESTTTVSFDTVGDHTLTLTASDGSGHTATRSVSIKVHKFADINGDESIDSDDFYILFGSWGTPKSVMIDLNLDEIIDSLDFGLLWFYFGK